MIDMAEQSHVTRTDKSGAGRPRQPRVTPTTRAYLKEFGLAMGAYIVLLPASTVIVGRIPHSVWRFPVALVPMVPAVFVLWAVVRNLGRMDELQRRIQIEALACAFGGTALITFSYGFLENVGFPHISWFFVWPIMAVLWLISEAIAMRRYR